MPGGRQSMKSSNFIPEDLFDVINESTEEDNEEESLRKYFTRQHYHEIQLDNKRDDIRRRVVARGCDSHSPVGLGVHRHGYWMYNPADYENLKVSPEIREVFQFITKYVPSPANCQVDVKLKPFIPEYYPSVGDIDAFIKVVHPEIKDDALGMKYLDEPSAFQSDPSVLDLRLRALAKQNSAKAIVVKKVENVSKNAKIIDNWINDISDLHRSKPSPSVHYSKPMPDVDLLIQEWPPEVEELVKNISLPSPALDCDLATYVDIVCNLLDIPVYKSRIQSLHVLSMLYATHKNFSQYGAVGSAQGVGDAMILSSSAPLKHEVDGMVDRLEL
jgi:intraflagellar transport protein 46